MQDVLSSLNDDERPTTDESQDSSIVKEQHSCVQSTISTIPIPKETQLVECEFMTTQKNAPVTYHSIIRLAHSKSRIPGWFQILNFELIVRRQVVAHSVLNCPEPKYDRARQGDCQESWMGLDGKPRPTPVPENSGLWSSTMYGKLGEGTMGGCQGMSGETFGGKEKSRYLRKK